MFISFFKKFMLMLLAVTAIVTPLGLHEGIVADPAKENVAFHYVRDTTPMGYGTSPRIETSWSRVCGAFDVLPCVNDDNEASTSRNSTTIQVNFTKNWYDSRISQQVVDVLQSGVPDLGATFSGPFDIQFRSYVESVVDDLNRTMSSGPLIDNGTVRTVGIYQPLSSLVLSDDLLAVEGSAHSGVLGAKISCSSYRKQCVSTQTLLSTFKLLVLGVKKILPEAACSNLRL
jgi:hypothetical protein